MSTKTLKYSFLAALLLLMGACSKEQNLTPVEEPSATGNTVHFSAQVSGDITRSSVDEAYQYVFESGDRLYVNYKEGGVNKLSGYISILSGMGSTTANFTGDLQCASGFTPSADTPITLTLVSSTNSIHSIVDGVVTGSTYSMEACSSFADAVRRFGNFTASGSFSDTSFILNQRSAFLLFDLTLKEEGFSDSAQVKLSRDNSIVYSWEVPTHSLTSEAVEISFAVAFPAQTNLLDGGADLTVQSDGMSEVQLGAVSSLSAMEANHYYKVNRTEFHWTGFAIEATQNNTGIKFVYASNANDGLIQYSLNEGVTWTSYTNTNTAIPLSKGDRLCVRSTRTTWNRWNGSPIFSSTNDQLCYLSGNILSLVCNSSWEYENITDLGTDVFNGAFSYNNGSANTYIDISPGEPLDLAAAKLGDKTFKNAFLNCTALTRSPKMPAVTLSGSAGNGSYTLMFKGCSSLSNVECLAQINVNNSCENWMTGVAATGTFVKKAGVDWNPGDNGIPSGWTVIEQQ